MTSTKAVRRTTRRAARTARKLGNATARTIATRGVPAARKTGTATRAVAIFLFVWAPRGLAGFIIGWAKLIPSRIPLWVGIKLGISGLVAVVALSVLTAIGFSIAAPIAQALGVYYSSEGRARVVLAVFAGMWLAAWALFGIIGRKPGTSKDGGLTGDTRKIANALETVLSTEITRAMAQSNGRPVLWISPLAPEYDDNGQRTGRATTITLPMGATFDKVKPTTIAQALGKPRDRIAVTEGTHPGEAYVFIADKSPSERGPVRWPWADVDAADITRPIPIGATPNGRTVTMNLFRVNEGKINGGSMLIGGTTDSGKTSFLRMLIAAAAMDPRTVIAVADFKGDDDYSGMAPALHWHRVRPTEANITAFGVMLGQVLDHMDAIKTGRADRVPILIVVDEAHAVLGTGKNPEVARQLEMVITQGRSFGVYVILAAQRPTSGAISTDLSANLRDRVCFRVGQQATGEVVVGAQPDDRNPYKFKVDGDQGLIMAQLIGYDGKVQTFYVNGKDAERIAQGHPAGGEWFTASTFPNYARDHDNAVQDPDQGPDPETLMAHANEASQGQAVTIRDLHGRLTAQHPDVYAAMTASDLAARLRAAGGDIITAGEPTTFVDKVKGVLEGRDRISFDELGPRLGTLYPEHDRWRAAVDEAPDEDARTAAMVANRAEIRAALRAEGIDLPEKIRIGSATTPGVTLGHLSGGGQRPTRTARTP